MPKDISWEKNKLRRDKRLGKIPDSVLADIYKVSVRTVRTVRREKGLGAYESDIPKLREALAADPDLATAPRKLLSERHGCSKYLVSKVRAACGVKTKHQHRRSLSDIEREAAQNMELLRSVGWIG